MANRKVSLVAGALGLLALGAAGGYWFWNRRTALEVEAARAAALLAEARGIIEASTSENIVPLAAAAFGRAGEAIGAAEGLLGQGRAKEALPASEAALGAARAAREEALARAPVQRAAVLRALRNQVLYRQAGAVAWANAREQMSLYDQDRISTKGRSEAVVRFDEHSEMRLEENSVLVVERLVESRSNASIAMTLAVPEGNVRSVIARQDDRDVRLEINLPKAGVVVDTRSLEGGRAEVGTRVHPDQSNRIAVYTGAAEVVGRSGEKVVVHQNQYTEVTADGALTAPRELPVSAITLLPGRDAVVYTSAQRPDVTFKWKSSGSCAGYRLEVARDAEFLDKVLDEKVARTAFTYGNLRAGKYLWRLSCLDPKGTQGAYSPVSLFEVAIDNQAPRLAVLSPEANAVVSSAQVEARCKTEAGVSVFINGEEAKPGREGEYALIVALQPGLNTLVFEAVDAAGNVLYNSRLVTRR